jgi:hypothetical protein
MSRYDESDEGDECEHELDAEGVCYGCGIRIERRLEVPPASDGVNPSRGADQQEQSRGGEG